MAQQSFYDEEKQKGLIKLRRIQDDLPAFTADFFRSLGQNTTIKTRINYAYDLRMFFRFLLDNHPFFAKMSIDKIKAENLDEISAEDIDLFLDYISVYQKENEKGTTLEMQNEEKGKARKLAAIRSMYRFYLKRKMIEKNPAMLVDAPKIHDKNIIRLEPNETADLLDEVEFGNDLTEHQQLYHEKTKARDLAIVTTLVGTGMRVSECVGINIDDIDFEINGVKVTRKGGNQSVLYFGDEVAQALKAYIEERKNIYVQPGNENALFLSMQGKRITTRSVQLLVKKYSQVSVKLKKITPHKLRSTYGTNLYQETGDIYLVADVLGHNDVNTTRKHYAKLEETRRQKAPKYIHLRKD
jgi:site-specific recombinase XerD